MIMPGERFPVHASSSGKVLCAFQQPALREQMLAECSYTAFRPNTITDPQLLREELARVREQGYAYIDDELDENVFALAVPVELDGTGVIYSLSMVGAHSQILGRHSREDIARGLRRTASELAQLLSSSRLDTPDD